MSRTPFPLVTIVTPSFNQGQFIEQTILSVINQTYTNIQYIIIDGDSEDNTMEVINKYKERINIIINEKDKGQTDAINKGFRLAEGELIGWINSDDIIYPHCVERIVELYRNYTDGAIFYGSISDYINEKTEIIKFITRKIPGRKYLLNQNYSVIQQGSFYSTDLVKKCNYLNEKLHYCMDLDLWLRLLEHGAIYSYNSEPLAAFRIWSETKTNIGTDKFLNEVRKTLLKYRGSVFSRNISRTYWFGLKNIVKKVIGYKN